MAQKKAVKVTKQQVAQVRAPAISRAAEKKVTKGVAIAALLINILVWPGLGTLIGGRTREGLLQMLALTGGGGLLIVVGIALVASVVGALAGLLLMLAGGAAITAAWIWGLITGIKLVNESE